MYFIVFFFDFQRHPTVTPQSYPQVQAPIVNNPAFWERLGSDNIGTDTLFFAFYYQQVFISFLSSLKGFCHASSSIYRINLFLSTLFFAEHLSTIFGCQRIKEAIMEVP